MSKRLMLLGLAVAACLLAAQPLLAVEGATGNLITTKWLNDNLKNSEVLILDASPSEIYAAKHIPGAVKTDVMTYGIREASPADMEGLLRSWGVGAGKKIVIYDQGATNSATRIFFSLHYYGYPVKDVFLLDGGLAKWEAEGRPVTKDVSPPPAKGSYSIKKLNRDAKAELPEFLTASGDPINNALVEALGANWHFGQIRVFDRAGHIPHGILLPDVDFYNPDKTFKSAPDIQKMLTYAGVKREQQIYTYCGGGVAASVPYFAIKFILNYPKVKMYQGSEMDWLADDRQLPYWTYDAPYLMRQTPWLQIWGSSQMLRMYRGADVSIIDVRPASAFNQGHLPFSLNIPADVFKQSAANPGKLAQILGPAGLNASHEAVVVSGAGLTPESALAFAMLEKVGQKKVSIFLDSMDTWTRLGYKLSKDPTAVGPRKDPHDVSIPPTTFPSNLREDVIVASEKTGHGIYPTIFVASGKAIPAKRQEGKVVHVPYTDLLNADGTPKEAKDIWNILSKAGIPRYAELVTFSEDPGEAAANYFILKLMGYPDVKMLTM